MHKKRLTQIAVVAAVLIIILVLSLLNGSKPEERQNIIHASQMESYAPEEIITEAPEHTIASALPEGAADGLYYNEEGEQIVFVSPSGDKFHTTWECSYLKGSTPSRLTLEQAELLGKAPCSRCAQEDVEASEG